MNRRDDEVEISKSNQKVIVSHLYQENIFRKLRVCIKPQIIIGFIFFDTFFLRMLL